MGKGTEQDKYVNGRRKGEWTGQKKTHPKRMRNSDSNR